MVLWNSINQFNENFYVWGVIGTRHNSHHQLVIDLRKRWFIFCQVTFFHFVIIYERTTDKFTRGQSMVDHSVRQNSFIALYSLRKWWRGQRNKNFGWFGIVELILRTTRSPLWGTGYRTRIRNYDLPLEIISFWSPARTNRTSQHSRCWHAAIKKVKTTNKREKQ